MLVNVGDRVADMESTQPAPLKHIHNLFSFLRGERKCVQILSTSCAFFS